MAVKLFLVSYTKFINAVKFTRCITGLGLKEAKLKVLNEPKPIFLKEYQNIQEAQQDIDNCDNQDGYEYNLETSIISLPQEKEIIALVSTAQQGRRIMSAAFPTKNSNIVYEAQISYRTIDFAYNGVEIKTCDLYLSGGKDIYKFAIDINGELITTDEKYSINEKGELILEL